MCACACSYGYAVKSLVELIPSGSLHFRPSKDLYYSSFHEWELDTTFSKRTQEPGSFEELQNSERGLWDTGENSGKLQVSTRNSRYEKSRGQLTCETGKDPAILPKRCGHLGRAADLAELVCGASLNVGIAHMCTCLGTYPQSHTRKLTHKQMPARHDQQEHAHILWKPLLESSHPR